MKSGSEGVQVSPCRISEQEAASVTSSRHAGRARQPMPARCSGGVAWAAPPRRHARTASSSTPALGPSTQVDRQAHPWHLEIRQAPKVSACPCQVRDQFSADMPQRGCAGEQQSDGIEFGLASASKHQSPQNQDAATAESKTSRQTVRSTVAALLLAQERVPSGSPASVRASPRSGPALRCGARCVPNGSPVGAAEAGRRVPSASSTSFRACDAVRSTTLPTRGQ